MLLHVLYPFKQGPWGGGNQFLRALRRQLLRQNNYAEKPSDARSVIVNMNPGNLPWLLKQVPEIKSRQPNKIIIARIDGPISLIRGINSRLDYALYKFINIFADGVIYQSNWSKTKNNKIAQINAPYQTIIHNAADPEIFTSQPPSGVLCERIERSPRLDPRAQRGARKPRPSEAAAGAAENERAGSLQQVAKRTKLIATSWSANPRKGFDVYRYLDQNLDFSRYTMIFAGNSPVEFQNIRHVKPVPPRQLAGLLRQHDIYLTASRNDPCSNALIEAISCGLPAAALRSGGHPELVQGGGELFEGQADVIQKIDLVARNLPAYQQNLPRFTIAQAAKQYLAFAQKIHRHAAEGRYCPSRINFAAKTKIAKMRVRLRLLNRT